MKYCSRNGCRISESFAPRFEMQLEHEQERDDAGVGLGEVAEVVVRRDLAGEDRVLLAHPVLDERVADAVHSAVPPAASIVRGTAQLARTS